MNDLRGAMGKGRASTIVPIAGEVEGDSRPSSRLRKWGTEARLSSAADRIEAFLADRGFERMPWLAVAMLAGIGLWFILPGPGEWLIAIGLCGLPAALGTDPAEGRPPCAAAQCGCRDRDDGRGRHRVDLGQVSADRRATDIRPEGSSG